MGIWKGVARRLANEELFAPWFSGVPVSLVSWNWPVQLVSFWAYDCGRGTYRCILDVVPSVSSAIYRLVWDRRRGLGGV